MTAVRILLLLAAADIAANTLIAEFLIVRFTGERRAA